MSSRAGFIVLVLLLLAGYWVFDTNQGLMAQQLVLWRWPGQPEPVRLSVSHAFLLAMGVGAALIALIWAIRGSQLFIASIFDRRSARTERELQAAYQRGLETLLTGRPERALATMTEILAKDDDHAGALMTGADNLRQLRRPAEAIEWRQKILAASSDDIPALSALADDHRHANDLPRAAQTLERMLELRPKEAIGVAERLREVLIQSGQYERAINVHDRLVKLRGDSKDPNQDIERAGLESRWAMQVAESGRPREAVSMLKKVLKRHARFVPAILDLARAHVLEGEEDAAIEVWIDGFERTNEAIILVDAEEYFHESRHEGDPIERAEIALRTFRRCAADAATAGGARPSTRIAAAAAIAGARTRSRWAPTMTRCMGAVRSMPFRAMTRATTPARSSRTPSHDGPAAGPAGFRSARADHARRARRLGPCAGWSVERDRARSAAGDARAPGERATLRAR